MRCKLATVLSICVAVVAPAVDACSRKISSADDQLFAEDEQVFVARILATEVQKLPRHECEAEGFDGAECMYVEGRYELVDALKGSPRRRGKVRDLVFEIGSCSLGLLSGIYYVFYVDKGGNWVSHVNGSFPLGSVYQERQRQAVERVRKPPHERPDDSA